MASGTYNYGPSNEALKERVETAVTEFKAEYKKATGEELTEEIPTDLLTASGSGLDPHISPASAKIQVPIVAANTGFEEEELYQMVEAHTEHKALGFWRGTGQCAETESGSGKEAGSDSIRRLRWKRTDRTRSFF